MSWTFDRKSKRYRERGTGRWVSQRKAVEMRDGYAAAQASAVGVLVERLARGELSVQELELRLRRQIKDTHLTEYMLGRGGRFQMAQSDFGRVGQALRGQYAYLHMFMEQVRAGQLSEGQIRTRAALYMNAATASYEKGHVASFGDLHLPAHPGDGSTECHVNCRCEWQIEETDTEWVCAWVVNASKETCATCEGRGREWSPYVVPKSSRSLRVVA